MTDSEQTKIFAHNLTNYVNQSGKMQKDIAKELGFPQQTFNGWCNGVSFPSMDKIQKLADYFHIGKSDLINSHTDTYIVFNPTNEERILIEIYRASPDTEKEMVKRLLNYYEFIKKSTEKE
jgi:repressor LexA